MLKVLSSILCDLDPKVKVIGQKAGICDGVPSTSALVKFILFWEFIYFFLLLNYRIVLKNLFWSMRSRMSRILYL